jgi:hypothetical protein
MGTGDRCRGAGNPDGEHGGRHEDVPGASMSRAHPYEPRSRQEYYDSLVASQSAGRGITRPWTAEKAAIERLEWQTLLAEGSVDRVGLGVIDERAKKFSAAERRIAAYLASSGPAVISVSEGFGAYGRTPDARVDAVPVEFKSLDPGASDRTVKAALNSAKGQARHAVIDARGSGLTEDEAERGIRRFFGTPHGNRMDAVLILGDNYSIDWKRGDG